MSLSIVRRAHTFKGEKYLNRRREESHNPSSWNSLYLNSDTVMEVISHKLGVKASDILDVDSGNMAVRVALAETEVLDDTKKWLEQHGVRLEVLEVSREGENDA
jgi:multiple RNA-binding domain-containing protein 1